AARAAIGAVVVAVGILPIVVGVAIVVGILRLAVLVALDAQRRVGLADDAVLGVVRVAAPVGAERLGDGGARPALVGAGAGGEIGDAGAGGEMDRRHDGLALRLGGGRGEQRLPRHRAPGRLDDRAEDRHRGVAAGRAAAERAAAVGVVVADPHGHRDIIRETDEPGVVLVLAGAGLAGEVGTEVAQRIGGAAQHPA